MTSTRRCTGTCETITFFLGFHRAHVSLPTDKRCTFFCSSLSSDGITAQAIIVVCIISRDISSYSSSSSCFSSAAALSQKQVRPLPLPSGVACPLPLRPSASPFFAVTIRASRRGPTSLALSSFLRAIIRAVKTCTLTPSRVAYFQVFHESCGLYQIKNALS